MGLDINKIKSKRRFYLVHKLKEREKAIKCNSTLKDLIDKVKSIDTTVLKIKPLRGNKLVSKNLNRHREFHIKFPLKIQEQYKNEFCNIRLTIESDKDFHRIHFGEGLPDEFTGIGLGYKIYKKLLLHFDYISSASNASDSAQNVWAKLILDPTINVVMMPEFVLIMKKTINLKKKAKLFRDFVVSNTLSQTIKLGTTVIVDDDLKEELQLEDKFKLKPTYPSLEI